jgi:transcriptional regulator with XRE-family HTH domain
MTGSDRITEGRLALGNFIRSQRNLANLSLRELARRTELSNPYLSQLERGLHEPSVRVLKALAGALNVSAETLLAQAGLLGDRADDPSDKSTQAVENALRADPFLNNGQKQALLAVYRSYLAEAGSPGRAEKAGKGGKGD